MLRRWAWITVGLALSVLGGLAGVFWIHDHVAERDLWRAGLVSLITLEALYGVAVITLPVMIAVLGSLLYRARRDRVRRPVVARWLLLCGSMLIGLSMAEMMVGIWRGWTLGAAASMVAEHAPGDSARQAGELPRPVDEVALPSTFPKEADDEGNEIDVVVLGESSAAGVPYSDWLSPGHIVTWGLQEAIPDRRFRLTLLATSGDTLEGQHQKLSQLEHRPDVLIVYCGHNEFSARFHWAREVRHYDDQELPTPWERFVDRVERTSPLCGLIRQLADKCRIAIPPPPFGYRHLVDVPVYTPAEYQRLLSNFRRRLETIVAFAERVGALPILIAPPANDSGFEPNRSYLPPRTSRAERDTFAREFRDARDLESSDPARALERYRALLARYPGFAETHYRLARLLERSGDWAGAYRHDIEARDRDGFPMRCPTDFQEVYRAVAARHDGIYIDAQAYFHAIGAHGLLDDHLFHDGMHPSLRGQIALAQAVLRALHARRPFGWPSDEPAPAVDPVACADHFELGQAAWEKLCLWGIMFYDLTNSLHYDPTARLAKQRAFADAATRIARGAAPESVGLPNIGIPEPVPPVPTTVDGPPGSS